MLLEYPGEHQDLTGPSTTVETLILILILIRFLPLSFSCFWICSLILVLISEESQINLKFLLNCSFNLSSQTDPNNLWFWILISARQGRPHD